jgi:hypothetical protein
MGVGNVVVERVEGGRWGPPTWGAAGNQGLQACYPPGE